VRDGSTLLNPGKVRAWGAGRECIWRQHGVWDTDAAGTPRLLRPDYFHQVNGREVDFNRDYFVPFARRCADAVQAADPEALIFVEGAAGSPPPRWPDAEPGHIVHAPHWYDGYVLVTQSFSRFIGVNFLNQKIILGLPSTIRRAFAGQLATLKQAAVDLGGAPILLGEFGIPFNLSGGAAYRSGDFRSQAQALDRSFEALEANLLNGMLWNYTADNTNARGDLWNGEDFSFFSCDQQTDPQDINSGGRALAAGVRPYARATAGEPLKMSFDRRSGRFELVFRHDPKVTAPTEIFVPALQYPHGFKVEVSDGEFEAREEEQLVAYRHTENQQTHWIRITR
jgi:hypothetical protein